MISPEDITILVDYLRNEKPVSNSDIERVTKKLELIKKQLDIQSELQDKLLDVRKELEALDKDEK